MTMGARQGGRAIMTDDLIFGIALLASAIGGGIIEATRQGSSGPFLAR